MNCPFCGVPTRREMQSEVIECLMPDDSILTVPATYPIGVCVSCNFSGWGEEGEIAREAAVKAARSAVIG